MQCVIQSKIVIYKNYTLHIQYLYIPNAQKACVHGDQTGNTSPNHDGDIKYIVFFLHIRVQIETQTNCETHKF